MNVFITGASSGIGQALALEYAKRYAGKSKLTLGLVARRESQLKGLQAQLQPFLHVQCHLYPVDVRDYQAMQMAADDFMQHVGTPNIVIANAGVSTGTYSDDAADIEAFHAVFDINVNGMLHTFQPFISAISTSAAGQSAQLVGIASVAGIRGLPGASAYAASKSAVITYLESLRIELAKQGIKVTTIAPGYIRTPMTDINEYPMPFLMPVEKAAQKFVDAIEQQKRYCVIPWQMQWVAWLIRLMPNVVWDYLMRKAPHKSKVSVK